jgi:uncharacterized RDD family membrane protein YckC
MPTSPGWRRLAAFGVDYVFLLGYLGLLFALGLGLRRAGGGELLEAPSGPRGRLLGQALGFTLLTLPVTLSFALADASRHQGTPGKRALRLRVVGPGGRRLSLPRALLRAALKLAPWEVAHTALWSTPGWPANPQPNAITWAGSALSLLGAAWYALSLFLGDRRTPYDRVTRSQVVRGD